MIRCSRNRFTSIFAISIVASICIPSTSAYCQDVLIEANVRPFEVSELHAGEHQDSLDIELETTGSTRMPDVGLTFRIGSVSKLLYRLDIGWNRQFSRSAKDNAVQGNQLEIWRTDNRFESNSLTGSLGVEKPLSVHPKLMFLIGSQFSYSVLFGQAYRFESLRSDTLGSRIGGQLRTLDYPDEHTIGIQASASLYYKLHDRFSIGFSVNNRFGYTLTSGKFYEASSSSDENGGLLSESIRTADVLEHRFAYNFSVSFGIQYQIAKRKDKKKNE